MLERILYTVLTVLMVFYFSINTVYLFILMFSVFEIRRSTKFRFTFNLNQAFRFRLLPPVSIILPAFNEEKTIVESVRSILFVRYPQYELLVVNDGSKDETLKTLIEAFNLIKTDYVFRRSVDTARVRGIYVSRVFKNIVVIDKENGGKADALNAGINVSRYPYFCAVDADTILGEDALAKLILPFVNDPDRTTAVGGIVRPANGAEISMGRLLAERLTKNLLVIIQSLEYARAFFLGRLGLASINSLLIISGAFGLFKKEDVLRVDGYKKKSIGEDMMLVVKLHKLKRKEKRSYRVAFVTDTVCWTEIPSTFRVLARQRVRWQMGLMESIFENGDMIMNPRYGVIGLFAMPFYILTEIVPPFFEIIGYAVLSVGIGTGVFSLYTLLRFFAITWGYSLLHTIYALVMESYGIGKKVRLFHFIIKLFASILESLFYRQINIWCKLKGFFQFFTHKREWGAMERTGFGEKTG
ncbi:MAG: glycosyltransferase family 2 protein [Spirochaetes bacterium]|nr:glycosyltransferase family 2 protein [Spirochaetota bacterium]